MLEVFSISSWPALASFSVIELATLMVLLLELLLSDAAMAEHSSVSVETLNVLSAIRGSRASRKTWSERPCR